MIFFVSFEMEKDITISDIDILAKSKKEIYHVLTAEGGLYLPPIMDSNNKYIQNIIRGLKKFLYSIYKSCQGYPNWIIIN